MKLKVLLAVDGAGYGKAYGLRHSLVDSAGFYAGVHNGKFVSDAYHVVRIKSEFSKGSPNSL